MTTAEELMTDPTVVRWLRSAGFSTETPVEQLAQVRMLASFCNHEGKMPQEILDTCLLEKTDDGQYEISIKGRRLVNAAIDEFATTLGLSKHYEIAAGNSIRGFLVHNGVLIQGKPSVP